MIIKRLSSKLQIFIASFAIAGIASLVWAPGTYAATKTWTGGDPNNNDWSSAANWSPSGAPANGDDIAFVVNNANISSVNDISGLTISGISATGAHSSGSGAVSIGTQSALTLTGDVSSEFSTSSTGVMITGSVTLGADVTFLNASVMNNAATSASLNLNGHELNMVTDARHTGSTIAISLPITGNGSLTVNVRSSVSLYMGDATYVPGGNTYGGTTDIITGQVSTGSGSHSSLLFGSSTINVSPSATLSIDPDASQVYTFSNPINIAAAVVGQSGFLDNQLYIWSISPGQTINIPNITLNGDARFAINQSSGNGSVVNLAGITANGHCVQYGSESNFQADSFQNGPPACVIGSDDNTVIPGTPNAGSRTNQLSKLAIVVSGVVVAAASCVLIARRKATN